MCVCVGGGGGISCLPSTRCIHRHLTPVNTVVLIDIQTQDCYALNHRLHKQVDQQVIALFARKNEDMELTDTYRNVGKIPKKIDLVREIIASSSILASHFVRIRLKSVIKHYWTEPRNGDRGVCVCVWATLLIATPVREEERGGGRGGGRMKNNSSNHINSWKRIWEGNNTLWSREDTFERPITATKRVFVG